MQLQNAWDAVTLMPVEKHFAKCGFLDTLVDGTVNEDGETEPELTNKR